MYHIMYVMYVVMCVKYLVGALLYRSVVNYSMLHIILHSTCCVLCHSVVYRLSDRLYSFTADSGTPTTSPAIVPREPLEVCI